MRTIRTYHKYGFKTYGVYEENSETDVELLDVFRTYPEARELAGEVYVVKGLDTMGRDFKVMQNEYIQALADKSIELIENLLESHPDDFGLINIGLLTKGAGTMSKRREIAEDKLGITIEEMEHNLKCFETRDITMDIRVGDEVVCNDARFGYVECVYTEERYCVISDDHGGEFEVSFECIVSVIR